MGPVPKAYYAAIRSGLCNAYFAASVVGSGLVSTSKVGVMGKVSAVGSRAHTCVDHVGSPSWPEGIIVAFGFCQTPAVTLLHKEPLVRGYAREYRCILREGKNTDVDSGPKAYQRCSPTCAEDEIGIKKGNNRPLFFLRSLSSLCANRKATRCFLSCRQERPSS